MANTRSNAAARCDAVQMLLQHGADPRLYADDGLTPGQQSSFEHVRSVLDAWDVSLTDGMLQKLHADRDQQRDDDRQLTAAETQRLETQLLAAEKEYTTVEKQVRRWKMLNSNQLIYVTDHFSGPGRAISRVCIVCVCVCMWTIMF